MNTIFLHYFGITLLAITNSVIDARCRCFKIFEEKVCIDEEGHHCDY